MSRVRLKLEYLLLKRVPAEKCHLFVTITKLLNLKQGNEVNLANDEVVDAACFETLREKV